MEGHRGGVCRGLLATLLLALPACRDAGSAPKSEASRKQAPARQWPTEFPVPFEGVITASYCGTNVTYHIARDRIQRESCQPAFSTAVVGVICDLRTGEAVLYRRDSAVGRTVRLPVAELRSGGATGSIRDGYATRGAVGRFFASLPPPEARQATSSPGLVDVDGLRCDRLTVTAQAQCWEIDHCPRIEVSRDLLELVEPGLPTEVTGFPVRAAHYVLVPRPPATDSSMAGRLRRWLRAGQRLASDLAEAVSRQEVQVTSVVCRELQDADFALPPGCEPTSSLAEFSAAFPEPSSSRSSGGHHHHDWH